MSGSKAVLARFLAIAAVQDAFYLPAPPDRDRGSSAPRRPSKAERKAQKARKAKNKAARKARRRTR